jgi:hypothetical protein
MIKLWVWCKNKFGRIITLAGVALVSVDAFDITPVKEPLTQLIGAKGVQALVIGCFALSWVRHQYVASQYAKSISGQPKP